MLDARRIMVTSVPLTETTAPIMAPALLKGILIDAGFDAVGIDLNGEFYHKILNSPYFDHYLRFFYYEEVDDGLQNQIKDLFDQMTDRILSFHPTVVCFSLLHYQCQVATKWLSFCIKKRNPDITIVIGGAGAIGNGFKPNEVSWPETLRAQKLIDCFISGDGDIALVELLKGNSVYPGINQLSWKPIEDLTAIPYADYDDYAWNLYESPFIGILGSRGCVRQCTFCDVHEYWEKFKWRTGEHIFQEILLQNKKYGSRFFKFQDSLINGNVKEYNALMALLAAHNRHNPDNTFHWASYFIFRPADQMPEKMWQLTAESGAIRLNVGIESVIEKNRDHIKKKFSNADIEYGLAMAKKYNIGLGFLIMVGYVTETQEDHEATLEWFRTHKEYAGSPVKLVNLGGTLAILSNTWLDRNQKQLGITWKDGEISNLAGKNHLWEIAATGNNYEVRVKRLNETVKVAAECGFEVGFSTIDPQKELENIIAESMGNA